MANSIVEDLVELEQGMGVYTFQSTRGKRSYFISASVAALTNAGRAFLSDLFMGSRFFCGAD